VGDDDDANPQRPAQAPQGEATTSDPSPEAVQRPKRPHDRDPLPEEVVAEVRLGGIVVVFAAVPSAEPKPPHVYLGVRRCSRPDCAPFVIRIRGRAEVREFIAAIEAAASAVAAMSSGRAR
jgi:hypothetical protein